MANQTKPKAAPKAAPEPSKQEEKLDEQIDVFDVAQAVDRTLTHPETGESKTFSQHEMSFMTKLKFFRLLSGTLRIAAQEDNPQAGIGGFLENTLGGINADFSSQAGQTQFITTVMKLVELVPDFAEEAYLYALNVKPKDMQWATEALESLDDDEGIDILEVFVAQNGPAVKNFFGKRLLKVGKSVSLLLASEDTEEESETTT